MAKAKFLLVDLNEPRTKKLAETITSDTSRKILNHLAEQEDSEARIATTLSIPISTVHYHLQKLQEAHLVTVEQFHYSPKGREVYHYKLANKYIIIAPGKVEGLKEKLKGILPVGLIILGISGIIKLIQVFSGRAGVVATSTRAAASQEVLAEAAPRLAQQAVENPDIALWFLIGGVVTIVLYLVMGIIRKYLQRKGE